MKRFIWHLTVSEYDKRLVFGGTHARIETCAAGAKTLDPVGISLMRHLRHQAIDFVMKVSKRSGSGPLKPRPRNLAHFQPEKNYLVYQYDGVEKSCWDPSAFWKKDSPLKKNKKQKQAHTLPPSLSHSLTHTHTHTHTQNDKQKNMFSDKCIVSSARDLTVCIMQCKYFPLYSWFIYWKTKNFFKNMKM